MYAGNALSATPATRVPDATPFRPDASGAANRALFRGAIQQALSLAPPAPSSASPLCAHASRTLLDPVADAMFRITPFSGSVSSTLAPVAAPEPPAIAPLQMVAPPAPATAAPPDDVALMSPPPAVTAPLRDAEPSPFAGLRRGQQDGGSDGPIGRMQAVLAKWNPRLDVAVTGRYDERTQQALLLYKTIYGSGRDGSSVDPTTAGYLGRMEDGTFWNDPPAKSAAGRILYAASQDLGKPYRMGADGSRATDCAMLTRQALRHAGLATDDFSRLADSQYAYAEQGARGLHLVNQPQPGDLVFFRNPTRQSTVAYHGVTHVGIYVGDGQMLAASSGHGRVVMQPLAGLARHVAGYARTSLPLASR